MKRKNSKISDRIQPPDFPSHLDAPLLPVDFLEKGGNYCELALSDWDLSGKSAEALTFECLLIERSNFSNTGFRRIRVKDVRMEKSDFSNADWSYASFDRVEFIDGRLTGLKAVEGKFRDLKFVNCKADLAQFRYASFRDARFEGCNLREADFLGADLRGVSFYGCDLRGANLSGAKLERADFRGAQLEGIALQAPDLKGLVIDSNQALELSAFFAQILGLNVEESL